MLSSFQIRNFRCFQELKFDSLSRINLIGGKNNTGKTTLLESLFLSLGPNNPELLIRLNAFRGIQQFRIQNSSLLEGPWKWLFRDARINSMIEIIERYTESEERRLTIAYSKFNQSILDIKGSAEDIPQALTTSEDIAGKEILLTYSIAEEVYKSRLFTGIKGELEIERAGGIPLQKGIFLSSRTRSPSEEAERFSKAEKENKQDFILRSLRFVEPRIKRLTLLLESGQPMIFSDIGIGELVPLNFMGEGLSRLLSILLAIIDASNGRVLIDEVENGLHYSVLEDAWKAIQQAAQDSNVQVFATTHSLECIRAAHRAFSNDEEYDFSYHRIDRKDGSLKAKTYDCETISTSIDMNFEMR
ncbi:ATP/GTP phosphatase [Halomicronema hongdechloris C2206]|uniref:ATP/GTP phosphatase n=1 Tax=Halomicronema hongdechloris C2206 TaxID=1641165 RepID=A0A1V8NHJ4_9CYAN|nr:AAA family ATPase [Halomicronema hongdechloris]ASC71694.1 ATP/GTP phosphatase [Halomicronema hongdechloris C2206]